MDWSGAEKMGFYFLCLAQLNPEAMLDISALKEALLNQAVETRLTYMG